MCTRSLTSLRLIATELAKGRYVGCLLSDLLESKVRSGRADIVIVSLHILVGQGYQTVAPWTLESH